MPETKDELYEEALKICLEHNTISDSLIRRRLRIGYSRAVSLAYQVRTSGKIKVEKYDNEKES